MRRSMVGLIVLIALGAALAAGWTSFRSAKFGFELNRPSGWKVTISSSLVRFKSSDPDGEFSVGILRAMTLEAWVKARRSEETLPDGSSRVEAVSDVRLAGRASKRIVLFAFDRYIAEEAVIAAGRLYVISYDSNNPNDPKFARHKAIYQTMRSSLKF